MCFCCVCLFSMANLSDDIKSLEWETSLRVRKQ